MSATLHLASSERHGAAPWLNEKQSEETGNNPRQAPAGCHKKEGLPLQPLPHAFSFNSMGWWKINGPTGQPLLRLLSATAPGSEPITKHQEEKKKKKEEWENPQSLQTEWLVKEFCVCVCVCVCVLACSNICWVRPFAGRLFYLQEMLNVSSLWIIFQTHFNPDLSLHPPPPLPHPL